MMMIDSDNVCSDDDPDDVGCWIVDRETHSLTLSFCIVSSLVDSRGDGLWLMREREREVSGVLRGM